MLKMMHDIGNKLEAKMDNLQETLTKEIQDIKQTRRDAKYSNRNKKVIRSNQQQNIGGRRTNK